MRVHVTHNSGRSPCRRLYDQSVIQRLKSNPLTDIHVLHVYSIINTCKKCTAINSHKCTCTFIIFIICGWVRLHLAKGT